MTITANQVINQSTTIAKAIQSPQTLKEQLPLTSELASQVAQHRQAVSDILSGIDHRLLLITGPCSLHDEVSALEYGQRLKTLSDKVADKILVVMRAYVEKPRTQIGWKGLAYDPYRTGHGDLAAGVKASRSIMHQLVALGLPLATEALNPLVMSYLDDLVTWTAIGARTAESQTHREMVSHLNMPVGIKNGTDGSVTTAINAMVAASHSHQTLGITPEGNVAILETSGNDETHLVLRGGGGRPNYDEVSIALAIQELTKNGCRSNLVVDCSHDNAQKQFEKQVGVARSVIDQRLQSRRQSGVVGLMLESHLHEGKQAMSSDLQYGVSITDGCIGWDQTASLVDEIYQQLG